MLTFICWYLAFSILVGLVASVGFLHDYELCRHRWWSDLMLICPLSWVVVAAFFIAYGFYKRRSYDDVVDEVLAKGKGGSPC